jgi:hypothetical protein
MIIYPFDEFNSGKESGSVLEYGEIGRMYLLLLFKEIGIIM